MALVACQACGFLWILYNIFQVEYDILNDIDFDGGNIILFKVVLIRSGGGDSEVLNKVGDALWMRLSNWSSMDKRCRG